MKVGKTNRIALNRAIDLCALPAIFVSALVLRMYRNFGSCNLPLNTATLKSIGTFPLCRHYYEPLFADSELK
ncbi:MAG: class I SAM-dependent methyltransferase, partial [Geminicoccaceae bacterium]